MTRIINRVTMLLKMVTNFKNTSASFPILPAILPTAMANTINPKKLVPGFVVRPSPENKKIYIIN